MSNSWREDDEEFKVGGAKGGLRTKPRFSFNEVRVLLEAVKMNRYIILRKFNQGVSAETKKQTWFEITNQINGLGENHREVRQIMKKWADLKCDGKRRIAMNRSPNLRKKNLGPVEKMVHKILLMSPSGECDSDQEPDDDEELSKLYSKGLTSNYSYLGLTDSSHSLPGGASYDMSPLSSPEKEPGDPFHSSSDFDVELGDDGERTMDFDENEDSLFSSAPASLPAPTPPASLDPLPDNALLRVKPVHTYSRSSQNHIQNHNYSRPMPGPSSSSAASTSSGFPSASDSKAAAAPPSSQSPTSSNVTGSSLPRPPPASSANDSTSDLASSSILPPSAPPPAPSAAVSSSSSAAPSSSVHRGSGSNPCDPLPAGASSRRVQDSVGQMATQSLQQQRASRMLLTSMSQSLEMLAQSVQLLVESQQEFVQESLLLQRETVDVLRDFSNTALTMLRDKGSSGLHLDPPPRF
ncbi:nuclear pore complex protein Nup214-like [Limanda limanda]|uniref:nuclear pore complex protein Nup214-like n=1 Tax=Limanda limanda TaxID=27771 RepID=UPI0029C82179|nr:nuclear pore complex protein Nup214-like [Limanda limanda]